MERGSEGGREGKKKGVSQIVCSQTAAGARAADFFNTERERK